MAHPVIEGRLRGEHFKWELIPVLPVARLESAWIIDPFVFGVFPSEFGNKCQVLLQKIDVKQTAAMVIVVENLELMVWRKLLFVAPPHERGIGFGFFGAIFPPKSNRVEVVGGDRGHADRVIVLVGDECFPVSPVSLPAKDLSAGNAVSHEAGI